MIKESVYGFYETFQLKYLKKTLHFGVMSVINILIARCWEERSVTQNTVAGMTVTFTLQLIRVSFCHGLPLQFRVIDGTLQ